jgi:hypothetical protein
LKVAHFFRERIDALFQNQAPTLIGCKFLKNGGMRQKAKIQKMPVPKD